MTPDNVAMRQQLQRVAAYRELCRAVRRSGRENAVFAAIMLGLAYFAFDRGVNPLVLAIYGILIAGELAVGLFKWFFPSAEGHLLDGIVLLVFAAVYFGVQFLVFQVGAGVNPVVLFLGLFMLAGAVGRFRTYSQLRVLFAERPSAEHIAWFDELVNEIRGSDPESDELAIDLATGPYWKAKLLGSMAFFVALRGGAVWIAGPDDFEILREKTDRGTGRRKAHLRLLHEAYPDFEITDASWANYSKWRAANPVRPLAAEPSSAPAL